MDKHLLTKGFTLLEMLIVISIISMIIMITFTNKISIDKDYYAFSSHYLLLQSEALRKSEKSFFNDKNISFNANGNVNKAQTIHFENNKDIVVELGGGRLVFK